VVRHDHGIERKYDKEVLRLALLRFLERCWVGIASWRSWARVSEPDRVNYREGSHCVADQHRAGGFVQQRNVAGEWPGV
jgi:hypothetical protein